MIPSGAIRGVAFGTEADGDPRVDMNAKLSAASTLGIATDWATISQVHGSHVAVTRVPGPLGEADAVVTDHDGLPLVVATADCLPIAIAGSHTIGLVHAGWRGIVAGVIPSTIATIRSLGDEPTAASIGPHIGPCCYEVGPEIIEALGGFASVTRRGTISADLASAARAQLEDIDVETSPICTMDDIRFNSFRRNGTSKRQMSVAWLP
jgi:YfiH family protein